MSWKASGVWKTPLPLNKKNDDSTFPGLAPASSPEVATKIEYDELQQNEIVALEAIYGEDFVMHTGTHSAWKVQHPTTAPPPKLTIRRELSRHSTFG